MSSISTRDMMVSAVNVTEYFLAAAIDWTMMHKISPQEVNWHIEQYLKTAAINFCGIAIQEGLREVTVYIEEWPTLQRDHQN